MDIVLAGGGRDDNWTAGGGATAHCALGRLWVAGGNLVAAFAAEPVVTEVALPCFRSVPLG